MFRTRRWVFGALFVVGALLLTVEPLDGQPPGGGRGKGGFGGKGGFNFNDPEVVFNFYTKGADVIDVSRMDPNQKAFLRRSFEKRGMPIPPDNAVITKAQFVEGFNRAQAARGNTPGGDRGGDRDRSRSGGGPTMTMSYGPGSGPPGGFGDRSRFGGGGPPSFGGGRDWGGGRDGGDRRDGGFRMSDEDIERRFAESDANKDGKLSPDEISDRSSLKSSFKEYDTNTDGYIDRDEYKKYIAARFGGGDSNGDGGYGSSENRRDKEKPKEEPVFAIRYGKLPAGLPDYWTDLDMDKDGQVGLYEWRADGRDVKEFMRMDLDGDGLLAPQEWQRFNVQEALRAKAVAAEEGIEVPGGGGGGSSGSNRGSFGGGRGGNGGMKGNWPGGGKGGDKSSDGRGKGKGGPNPFRGGKSKG